MFLFLKNKFTELSKGKKFFLCTVCVFFIWYCLCLPAQLFNDPTCTVLEDQNGTLISARIADDGQWRFPYNERVPGKFKIAIVQFEDKYFFSHPGVNPISIVRALWQDIASGRIVSGGSTLTMQTIRLSRKGKGRTFLEKFIEIALATRSEISFSKDRILSFYASNAPFGGNVVGLDAAAWRYFGRSPEKLSWAETATLAVLPNAPSLIYPGKNHEKLLAKRNRLLEALWRKGHIDSLTCVLSKSEPLPGKPFPLPQLSPQLLDRAYKEDQKGLRVRTTLDAILQERVADIVEKHALKLRGNQIFNAAAVIADVETGNVLAYVGNVADRTARSAQPGKGETRNADQHGTSVDIITSARSTGSILKPFLFAAMLSESEILPNTLVPDIPMQMGDFSPQNYYLTYDGAVPARRALARSLNVPCVKMLQQFGTDRFHYFLKKIGITTLNRPADHYGLSLILGGAEARLWDLAGIYASMARSLNHYSDYEKGKEVFFPLRYSESAAGSGQPAVASILDPASIYLTFEAMSEVNRPDIDASWQMFSSSSRIAWKTGTSFGYRDGWAIGVTPKYVVGVWVGNANGEGRPDLTGIGTAAPILFELFGLLKTNEWFKMPKEEMKEILVCRESGCRATEICEHAEKALVQPAGLKTMPCPYHRMVHLDPTGRWRVNSECEEVSKMTHKAWFVLPPAMEWYYKTKNPTYTELPQFRSDCKGSAASSMEVIYPRPESKIYVPVELDESAGKTVFKVAHRKPQTSIYWHLDDNYIGTTKGIHQMGFSPGTAEDAHRMEPGRHTLTLVDEYGESVSLRFEVIGKK